MSGPSTTPRPARPPPYPSNFAGRDEHADAERFARALRPPPEGLHVLHNACPPVTPLAAGLDVLLFRAVLLVAYAAADEVVIARGADLDALRRLAHPAGEDRLITALAFRERDAALAVAFGTVVVVFEGWSDRAKDAAFVFDSAATETVLDLHTLGVEHDVVSLSWNAEGTKLCAVADYIIVWTLQPSYLPVRYHPTVTIPPRDIPTLPLAMGAISPNGAFVAASGLFARVSYVWALPRSKHSAPDASVPCTELVHGRSGIATLDWKKRGGGNPALMTADRDGSIRLWVKAPTTRPGVAPSNHPGLATGAESWMEEIARSPHVERTPRAGATFLNWGGGGGVADDEGDAMATNAAHPLLAEGTAPKPSRCYHWIMRIAGGDARGWRVRGLDDRPRAEFARLEPGAGDPLLGVEEDFDPEFRPPDLPLRDVAVAAMKAVSPIPLTTASQYKIGLVKSYAISNGERRLRSPEPPEPPNLVAIFVLSVRNGLPSLARYDVCPTSTMPAICRARIGVGHSAPVVDLVTSEQSSSPISESGGWLASRAETGNVIIWRTNVSTGAWDPLIAIAALSGPHTAVAFAPQRLVSRNLWEVGVFTCDSALGSLRLFQFVNLDSRREKASVHDIQFAKQVAVCQPRGRGSSDLVSQLIAVPLGKSFLDPVSVVRCAVFGIRASGRLSVWSVSRRRKDEIGMEPSVIRFAGGRHGKVTSAASSELSVLGGQIFVAGGSDGSAFVYSVSESADANRGGYVPGDSEEEEPEEGVIWLRELCHLPSSTPEASPVETVEVLKGGSRILVMQANGKTTIWSRSAADSATWQKELSLGNLERKGKGVNSQRETSRQSVGNAASIGYDHDGNFSTVVLKRDGVFERYRRVLGMTWETVQKNEVPCDRLRCQTHVLKHIGKGVLAATNGRGVSVLATVKPDSHPLSFVSGAAGYSPSKAIVAQLLTGGRAWQAISSLDELHNFVRKVTKRKASETSYGGRGLIPPPPPLAMLLSDRAEAESGNGDSANGSSSLPASPSSPFQMKTGSGNLFAQLMARSEALIKQENGSSDDVNDTEESNENGAGDLSMLASRLKKVSLAGVTRSEQSVLAAISVACSSLRTIFRSLDSAGSKFALLAACHLEISETEQIPLPIVASAVHSSSADALMDHFLPQLQPGQTPVKKGKKMWDRAKLLGAGWWLSSTPACKKLAERIARADFNSNRNPDDAALWYIALGRVTTLSALYRSQQNNRMAGFLRRNFSLPENRLAAGKNAYVLVSKHRLLMAVAFFLLADDVRGALSLIRERIKDDQLAIFLARILKGGEYVQTTLEQITQTSARVGDDHRKSLAEWLRGCHNDSLMTASTARYPPPSGRQGDSEKLLAGSLPAVVHALTHVLAIVSRPPLRGTERAVSIAEECRTKASRALLGDGSPVASLVVNFEVWRAKAEMTADAGNGHIAGIEMETSQNTLLLAAVETLKGRAVCLAGAVRSGAAENSLQNFLLQDIRDLSTSPLGVAGTMKAVEIATFALSKEDEVDAGVSATCAALETLETGGTHAASYLQAIEAAQHNCLRVAVSRALFFVQGALSLLHHPTFTSQRLSELLGKYKAASAMVERADLTRNDLFRRLVLEFKGAVISLRFALAFLRGDWPGILYSLRSCEFSLQPKMAFPQEEATAERELEDNNSMTSGCSSLAPDSVSVEALRHVASNPAVLQISKSLVHIRRYRKTPSMSMVGVSSGTAATVSDDFLGTPTLAVEPDDPYAVIRIHPALSCTLAAVSAAYLAAHLASCAAEFAKIISEAGRRTARSQQHFWQSESGKGYDQSFRLIRSSEALEQISEDAIAHWTPLQRFGSEADSTLLSQPEESAGAFVDLWSTLGCLPEYAPSLSEAATVAAAEMAAAASRAAIEAAEQKDGGRRRRRRRERRGEYVQSVAKEGLKLFDTTSADSLYGAYPVRFSASASGPWSGRGKHASLYREDRALFRTLCVSSTDPPAVIVATPKGIQEIVPSSYTTMPAGFRTHYLAKKKEKGTDEQDGRLEALASDRHLDTIEESRHDDESFLSSYDGFGEGPYVALELEAIDSARNQSQHRGSGGEGGRKAVWRHQVHATTLAAHPLRRRFASGGTDGVVRLWGFADPISLAAFREDNFGRIADLCFSAYGNTLLAVYSSGHVTIWDDPDVYSSYPRAPRGSRGNRAKVIRAFDNRAASGGAFLDERHTIAVVGDPTAPPSVGQSLRIFDTREPNSSFHASWSAAVNHQSEARCLTLLEDRMRVVTGGLDGSLSIVDIRTKTCIAELPAHADEVTCLALEMPRGRALVSGSADGEIKLWDSRTLLQLDVIQEAHKPTRHYWSGNGIGGLVGSYGTQGLALTDRSLISCGGDGVVKIWGPGWSDFDLNVL